MPLLFFCLRLALVVHWDPKYLGLGLEVFSSLAGLVVRLMTIFQDRQLQDNKSHLEGVILWSI